MHALPAALEECATSCYNNTFIKVARSAGARKRSPVLHLIGTNDFAGIIAVVVVVPDEHDGFHSWNFPTKGITRSVQHTSCRCPYVILHSWGLRGAGCFAIERVALLGLWHGVECIETGAGRSILHPLAALARHAVQSCEIKV